MSEIPNIHAIEAQLRSLQRENKIPRYICYWADGSVTQTDSCISVLEAASLEKSDKAGEILVGYLIPHGQFVTAWDLQRSYVVTHSHQFAYIGERWVEGLFAAIKEMVDGQWNRVDSYWAEIRLSPEYPSEVQWRSL